MNKSLLIRFAIFFSALPSAMGQTTSISPYSWFGVGQFATGQLPQQMLTGFSSATQRTPFYINPMQPASLSALRYSTFESGGSYQGVVQSNQQEKVLNNTGGFQSFAFAVPLNKRIGIAASMQPFSSVGYTFVDSAYDPGFGSAKYTYSGRGGLNQATFGIGIAPWKWFSIGATAQYLFGSMDKKTALDFDNQQFRNVGSSERLFVSGWHSTVGAQLILPLGKKNQFVMGATQEFGGELQGYRSALLYTYANSSSSTQIILDTAEAEIDAAGDMTLAGARTVGARYSRRAAGSPMDVWSVQWEQRTFFGEEYRTFVTDANGGTGQTNEWINGRRWSMAATFIPALVLPKKNWTQYASSVEYKVGFLQENTGLLIRSTPIERWSLSLGAGFPLGGKSFIPGDIKFATLHFGVLFGSVGTQVGGLVREDFVQGVVGITLNDQWFQKFKFR